MAKVFIEESHLTAIGDAIRAKTGKSELLNPTAMPTEIEAIQTGGGDIEPIVLKGTCTYALANPAWNGLFSMISTQDLTSTESMFMNNIEVENIPFDFNGSSSSGTYAKSMFDSASNLKTIGKIKNFKIKSMAYMFNNCQDMRYLPTFENADFSELHTETSTGLVNSVFNYCYSLRSIPEEILKEIYSAATNYSRTQLYYAFQSCYALDEIRGLSPRTGTVTSNMFSMAFQNCGRVKEIIFDTNEDGTPIAVNWSKQTIDLTYKLGATSTYLVTGYNSGITADKEVIDDATYQALKNDPDWYTTKLSYSRYNHDSAVNTINSLPDVTQGSGNTIKFYKLNGEYTDGGAIGNLTEEEIAVAAAKGWTVTLTL